MADWPLSPAASQRQQQLNVRRQLKQIAEIERADARAAEMASTPFSPTAFLRNGSADAFPKSNSNAMLLNSSTTGGGLTTGSTTPRYPSVRYNMGYSNLDDERRREAAAANDSPARRLLAARNHLLNKSDVSHSARKEPAPHVSASSQITHGGRNPLGSHPQATNADGSVVPLDGRSPARSFVEQRSRARSAGLSAASKFNSFSSTLNASKHAHHNPNTKGWNGHINVKMPTARTPATSAKIDKSAKDVNEHLEKHLNDLIGLKYRCEQQMDAMSKAYSVLVKDSQDAEEVVHMLSERYHEHSRLLLQWNALPALATESPSLRHQKQRMADIAAADPHRAAFKDGMWTLNPLHNTSSASRKGTSSRLNQAEAGASHAASARGAGRGGALLAAPTHSFQKNTTSVERRPDTAAFVGLNNAEKALHYAPVILKEIAHLRGKIDRCRQLLSDTAAVSDKLQHSAMLIDVATNVDLICLGRLDGDASSLMVPASPAYPNLTLSDFDAVENEAASLTAYCTRAAAELRKTVQSAVAGHSQCFEALVAAMKLGVACAEAKQAECQRQIEEIDRDTLLRVQRHLDDCLQEEASCAARLAAVEKIVSVRSSALGNNVFGDRGGHDPVIGSAMAEIQQLRKRVMEIEAKKDHLLAEYDALQQDRAQLVAIAESAVVSQQLVEEIKKHHL